MKRREFLRHMGLGLAAGWAASRLAWPPPVEATNSAIRLALLADAHLKDGDDGRFEARALARAVAEIRALYPAPDLVLFAGDLAHDGDAGAFALGRKILSDLPAPVLAVRGEGDGDPADGALWQRLFGDYPFLYSYQGLHLLGLDTTWEHTSHGPAFALGEPQRRWLASTLPRLDPGKPLIVLSHAPLSPLFRPWGQWTMDSAALAPLLADFRQVLCLHGHVHRAGGRDQGSGVRNKWSSTSNFPNSINSTFPETRNPKPKTQNLSLPATAWPYPLAQEGTPRKLRPGLGPQGCGWLLLSGGACGWEVQPHSWLA